ncbi:MotA/TolQ/ExbB proton channel family protein [Parendozoicomonas sp. Alg238-R29]|uniref:MotA/TolQ/ExbB proton channel family protein n=1 Tax=Parendozoicomonas sp. Alg238-R29 TaxID=2993446 RepID=UPI00248F1B5A|nr:MotA/TolQ/ExbB proton channel family protein [Parendozoicomonas sp. Alg238-R29]
MNMASDLLQFLDRGGWVLWMIFLLCTVLLSLLAERVWFFGHYTQHLKKTINRWKNRQDRNSQDAQMIRTSWLAQEQQNLQTNFHIIRTLIMICPLAGLLGTVTGMIELFSQMGQSGLPESDQLLAGLTRICLPTLAGLATAVTGLWLFTLCQNAAQKRLQTLSRGLAQ